jgi:hypothetical protein
MTTDNQKIRPWEVPDEVHALLVDEEMARAELLKNIENLLKIASCPASEITNAVELSNFMSNTEQAFFDFEDYMVGIKELTDLLKEPRVTSRDTEPHHIPFDLEKAPDTKRCK